MPVLNPLSRQCRVVLEVTLETGHTVVLSPEGSKEWRKHASGFSRRWLVEMFARRQVLRVESGESLIGSRLSRLPLSASALRAIAKDIHLLEAALATDRIVISRDEEVRRLFREACGEVREIRQVSWANPEIEVEGVADWVREGARAEAKRRLGSL
jgi:hypothetical protein